MKNEIELTIFISQKSSWPSRSGLCLSRNSSPSYLKFCLPLLLIATLYFVEVFVDSLFPASRGSFPGVRWREKRDLCHGSKCLWFNRRPQSWTALFETHAPSVVRWPQLAPVGSRSILYINSAVIYWAHIVNMACSSAFSKEFNRKE